MISSVRVTAWRRVRVLFNVWPYPVDRRILGALYTPWHLVVIRRLSDQSILTALLWHSS